MLSCREVSRLVSESLERPLPWRRRLGLWMHLRLCVMCRAFARQLQSLRAALSRRDPLDAGLGPGAALPPEARRRIAQALASAPPPDSAAEGRES